MIVTLFLYQVGDRVFTDVVYGNKHGFLTILTDPFSLFGEPFIVKQVFLHGRFLFVSIRLKGKVYDKDILFKHFSQTHI